MTARKTPAALALLLAALGCLALAAPAPAAKKVITKTYSNGVGGDQGGVPIAIPDGGGQATQLVRSAIKVKKLNPRGNIKDVDVSVRIGHPRARDIEIYLASPRGVINLTSDNGGNGNDYGAGLESCGGSLTAFDSDAPTPISGPGLQAPFIGGFAPEESLDRLNNLGGKKATNADWSLLVEDDDSTGPAGTLFCWELRIRQTNPAIGRK
jgi:subtilisin-like proprotein convertase family protein